MSDDMVSPIPYGAVNRMDLSGANIFIEIDGAGGLRDRGYGVADDLDDALQCDLGRHQGGCETQRIAAGRGSIGPAAPAHDQAAFAGLGHDLGAKAQSGFLLPLSSISSIAASMPMPRSSPTTGRDSSVFRSARNPVAHDLGLLDQALMLPGVVIREPHGAADGTAGIGRGVHEFLIHRRVLDRLVNGFRHHDPAQRQIEGGDALGEGPEIRLDPPMARREPFSGAAKAGDDLVGDQQDAVPVANLAQTREIGGGWGDDAAGADHGFIGKPGIGRGVRQFLHLRRREGREFLASVAGVYVP